MSRLTIAVVLVATLFVAVGCGNEGEEGFLCDAHEDCNSGLVCVTQVLNCPGEECWGTCERECIAADECDGGDLCLWVNGGHRVCRSAEYDLPAGQ